MKAVIFDVDGTLIDSVDLHAKCWQQALEYFGYNFTFEKIRSQIGKGGDQLLPSLLPQKEVEQRGREIEEYRGTLFRREFLPHTKAFPKVRALFERLKASGWQLALASSAKKLELKVYKDLCNIADLLQVEICSEDVDRSKPYPDLFATALRRLGSLSPRQCFVVGDSPYDALAASQASIPAIGFLCGGFSAKQLKTAGCKNLYRDPSDLLLNYNASVFAQT